jgi:hypothetical protein
MSVVDQATEYATERVKRGLDFELEGTIWHFVLEGAPHAIAGALGVSVMGGHVVVFTSLAAVVGVGLVIRRRVVRRRVIIKGEVHAQHEVSSLPTSQEYR